jgi:DNA-binding Lrp family transcriptional regulator
MAFNVLDALDQRLIALLRADGRAPISRVAAELHVSRGTAQARLDRLVATGVILGFTVRVRSDVEQGAVHALTSIGLVDTAATGVIAKLREQPAIRMLHTTNGSWDLVAEIQVETLQELDAVLRAIRGIEGVHATETSILLSSS